MEKDRQIQAIKESYQRLLATTTDDEFARVLRLALARLEAQSNGKGEQ